MRTAPYRSPRLARLFAAASAATLLVVALAPVSVAAAGPKPPKSGGLDATFGTGGLVLTAVTPGSDSKGRAIAIDAAGRSVVAGGASDMTEFALARYSADGSLDATFGTGGLVLTDFGGGSTVAQAVAIDAKGRIVAGGFSGASGKPQFALARYLTNGRLDTSFDKDGLVLTDLGGEHSEIHALAIDGKGRIVVAGSTEGPGGEVDFAVARYTPNGKLDRQFGSLGIVVLDVAGDIDHANGVAIDDDGRIVVSGQSLVSGTFEFAVARFTAAGTLDGTFGVGGIALTAFSGRTGAAASRLAIDASGGIVVVGVTWTGAAPPDLSADVALARYLPDGSLDTGFGDGGTVVTDLRGKLDVANAVGLDSLGRIVVAGVSDKSGSEDFALLRYTPAGVLDRNFGNHGIVLTAFGRGSSDDARALAIDADGRIVAAGVSQATGGNSTFALARYNP